MKSRIYLFAFALVLSLSSISAYASTGDTKEAIKAKVAAMSAVEKEERVKAIHLRAEQIKTMNKSMLSRTERKELRNELKAMNYEAKALGSGGVYLSLAAIIIIILLLILIL